MTVDTAALLLERERELDVTGQALARAERAEGSFHLIEATAGMGKTSLLRAAADEAAAAGFTCLRARASELERGFAYGCIRQLVEPAVASDAELAEAPAVAPLAQQRADSARPDDARFHRRHGSRDPEASHLSRG